MSVHDDEVPELEEVPDLLEVGNSDTPAAEASTSYDRPKIPITLLTGYLGAGKSTLLDYILTANHGYRIAVCMNDFGDTTDIEAKAMTLRDPVTGEETSSMLSLPNGCLCCSVKDLGIAAIEEMVASQRDGVDWVIVELTGVADPAPIAKSFWANEEMGDLILDAIICVVDSRNILKQLGESREVGEVNEAQKQVAASDVILLNKLDLVSPEQLAEVESVVRSLNPTLRIHKTTKSQIDLAELHNLQAYSSAPPAFLNEPSHDGCNDPDHDHDHHHSHDHGVHNSGITTATVPLPRLTSAQFDLLNTFVETVLWKSQVPAIGGKESRKAPEVLRTKGFISVDDGRRMILQGVTDLFELKELPQKRDRDAADPSAKVVFIGRGVEDSLRQDLLSYIGVSQ